MQVLADTETIPDEQSTVAFGYYAELSNARSINELKNRISCIIQRLGFTDFSFIQLAKITIAQPALCTLPVSLINDYFSNHYYAHDITLQKSTDCAKPFFQSTLNEYLLAAPFVSDMTINMRNIYRLHKSYGYYDYYHVPYQTDNQSDPVLLSVTKRGISPIELKHHVTAHASAILLLCEAINAVLRQEFHAFCYVRKKMTAINPKPLRVLETLANNDLTIEQVAVKLKISVVTANQHLKTVRNLLGTRTNYAAIKHALLEKLIRLEHYHDIN